MQPRILFSLFISPSLLASSAGWPFSLLHHHHPFIPVVLSCMRLFPFYSGKSYIKSTSNSLSFWYNNGETLTVWLICKARKASIKKVINKQSIESWLS